jgi:hypothetical protein
MHKELSAGQQGARCVEAEAIAADIAGISDQGVRGACFEWANRDRQHSANATNATPLATLIRS